MPHWVEILEDLLGSVFEFVANLIVIIGAILGVLAAISSILVAIWEKYLKPKIPMSEKSYGELALESIKNNTQDPPVPYGAIGNLKRNIPQESRFRKWYMEPDLVDLAESDSIVNKRRIDDKRTGQNIKRLLPYLEEHKIVVVLGEPGGGKSWLMRSTYCKVANWWEASYRQYCWLTRWIRKAYLDQWFPIYIPLRDWSKTAEGNLEVFIQRQLKLPEGELKPFYNELMKRKCILLFDGLDEINQLKAREAFLEQLQAFIRDCSAQIQVVLTSREISFSEPVQTEIQKQAFLKVNRLLILCFNRWQVETYLANRFDKGSPIFLGIWKELDQSRLLLKLARTPLLLGSMASYYESQWEASNRKGTITLPKRRTDLYRKCTQDLIAGWPKHKYKIPEMIIREDYLDETLRYLAFHLQQEDDEITHSDLVGKNKLLEFVKMGLEERKIPKQLREKMPADDAVKWIAEYIGFLEYDPRKGFYFGHRTFQEYFAACYVVEEQDNEKRRGLIDSLIKKAQTNPAHWQEVIVMLAGSLKSRQERIELIRALMKLQETSSLNYVILSLRAFHEAREASEPSDSTWEVLIGEITTALKALTSHELHFRDDLIYVAEFVSEWETGAWDEFVEDMWPGDTEDSLIRRIEALGAFDDPKAAEYLVKEAYLSRESTWVRTAARQALISLGDLSVEPLFKLLRGAETSTELAEQILIVLASIRHAKIIVQVIEWLAKKDQQGAVPSDLLEAASRAVAAQDTKDVKSYLSPHIVSSNKSMCQWAIRTWAEIGKTTKFDPKNLRLATEELVELLNRHTGHLPAHGESDLKLIEDEAARALAALGNPAVTLLGERIIDVKETKIEERKSAAFALGFVQEAEHELAIGFLIEALNDPENAVLSTARKALKQIGCVARPYLEKKLESTKNTRHKKQIKLTLDGLNCYDQLQEGGSR